MTIKTKKRRQFGRYLIGLGVVAVILVALVEIGIIPSPYATTTRTILSIRDLGGNDYEVTYTNSDTLAKNEIISVYVMKTTKGENLPFAGWFHRRTLLFQYDPALSIDPPSITEVGPHVIRINIPRVSSIFYERRDWDGFSVDYQIGRVDYPE